MIHILELDPLGVFICDALLQDEDATYPLNWTQQSPPVGFIKPALDGTRNHETGEWAGVWVEAAAVDPVEALNTAKLAAYSRNNSAYDRANSEVTKNYPQSEKDTWPTQDREIKAYQANPTGALTPWIDTAALHRGISRELYIEKTLAKITQFEQVSAYLTGRRQGFEDQIKAATDAASVDLMVFTYSLA